MYIRTFLTLTLSLLAPLLARSLKFKDFILVALLTEILLPTILPFYTSIVCLLLLLPSSSPPTTTKHTHPSLLFLPAARASNGNQQIRDCIPGARD